MLQHVDGQNVHIKSWVKHANVTLFLKLLQYSITIWNFSMEHLAQKYHYNNMLGVELKL